MLAGPTAWRFIDAVPPERGIIVGAGDASTERLDETEVLVWAMAWAAQGGRGQLRVGVPPTAASARSIGTSPIANASASARRSGSPRMGPLQDVAEALDETPIESQDA